MSGERATVQQVHHGGPVGRAGGQLLPPGGGHPVRFPSAVDQQVRIIVGTC